MALGDVLGAIRKDKPEKKAAEKRYVTFSSEEWKEMEEAYGSEIEPADVKALIQGIFNGTFKVQQ